MKLKKNRILVLCGLIVLFIVGCSSNSTRQDTATRAPEPEVAEEIVVTGARSSRTPRGYLYEDKANILPDQKLSDAIQHRKPIYKIGMENVWSLSQRYQLFRDYGVNPTILTEAKPDSTFSLDVDDGSYKLALKMLSQGTLPSEIGIRVEDFVNAQPYRYVPSNDLFSLSAEAMPSPFRGGYHVLHLGLQTKALNDNERLPANIVLVADVSGSMSGDNKLVLLKEGFSTLVSQLRADDQVALVAYSDSARIILKPTPASKKRKIIDAIDRLHSGGSTNAAKGFALGYKLAEKMYQPGIINRVIFSSDGMANVGADTPEEMLANIGKQRQKGIFLTTVGVGVGMYNDALMEQLANQGNGNYLYLGDKYDIQSVFVDQLTTQLQTVAKNAKAQVVFNKNTVSHYRLLGYENRALNREDFLDASKDGGEIGAGHRVTAIYEIKLFDHVEGKDIANFRVAYQKPDGRKVFTHEKNIPMSVLAKKVMNTSSDMRLSASAAAFAEKLRMSYWSGLYEYGDILDLLSSLPPEYIQQEDVKRLRNAIREARNLDTRSHGRQLTKNSSNINLDHVPLLK